MRDFMAFFCDADARTAGRKRILEIQLGNGSNPDLDFLEKSCLISICHVRYVV